MRIRNADSSKSVTPKRTPPARKAAAKTAAESPAAKRTPASRTRQAKKNESSPAPDPIPDSKPQQSPGDPKSCEAATTTKSAKKKGPGRPRTRAAVTPKLGEQFEAVAVETLVDRVEEPRNVIVVDLDTIEDEKEGELGVVGSVVQSEENEQKPMEVDEPFVENLCESAEKGKNVMEVEVAASEDASDSREQPERAIVDLNLSVDGEDSPGAKDGEKGKGELKEQEGEKGKEELKEQEGQKGEEELKEQEGEKGGEELKEQVGEKGGEELKEQVGEKGNEELKEQEGEKGEEELKEQKGEKGEDEQKEPEEDAIMEDLKEQEGGKKKELKEPEGEKEEEELKEQEGDSKIEDLKEHEREKEKDEMKEREGEKENEELKEDSKIEEFKEQEREKEKEEFKEQEERKAKEESKEEQTSNTESYSEEVGQQLQKDVNLRKDSDDGTQSGEKLDLGEQGGDDLTEEEDPEEPREEAEALQAEHMELEAIAKQRKIKKEHEIFVGGLDREVTEEDLRKVFQRIGDVVEVRLHKSSSTNKNKGYAFVKFANKEHAKKALSEMKNPVINGKRCGTAPSEDNDTLFLGNICNTWTKEAIKQKLKDYGVEGVENITLVPDVQNEGLSRGFAFIEFSCHADAMLAYKRLQKPDAIFGHAERTAKVAFAEPIREPDPEIMAQVKSVFINGLPPHWEEDHVRELFKSYGEIVRVVLARNMSTAKRKDYGFVDFSTHEAAVACVDGVNKSELGDGASKIKVRARLSNPLPKTQAVKGGMCGGFRIGHTRSGAFPRSVPTGRGFGRGRQPYNNWGSFVRDRNSYHAGRSHTGRMGFRDNLDYNNSVYPDFHQRQFGPQGAVRGGHYAGSRGAPFAGPSRPYLDRPWYGAPEVGPSEPIPPRRPYSPVGQFDRPFLGRHFDDPYFYDDNVHGVKRSFYMTDPEPDYTGPSRLRPRLDYPDPPLFHGNRYHDSLGVGNRPNPLNDYYGSDYGGGPYASSYGGGSSHGRGYYY